MNCNTDTLITALADDLKPVRAIRFATGMGWLIGGVLATLAISATYYGLRADLMTGQMPPMLPVISGVWLILGLACASTAIAMGNPQVGRRQSGWRWAVAMAALLPLAALVAMLLRDHPLRALPVGTTEFYCMQSAMMLGLLTAAVQLIWLRRAAPTSPHRAGLLVGLGSGSIGVFAFSLHCPVNSIEHLGFGHALPIIASAALGWLLLPRFLKW